MIFAFYPIYLDSLKKLDNHLKKISEDIKTPEISLEIGEGAMFNLYIFEVSSF